MPLRTYLAFPGCCAEALEAYATWMGGRVTEINRRGDAGPDGWQDKCIHATWIVDSAVVFGCDLPPGQFQAAQGTSLSWNTSDIAEARRVFDLLADGGTISVPFGPAPWSDGYGCCTDRFGIPWQVNVDRAD